MKRAIAIVVILALLIGFATFEQVYFQRTLAELQNQASALLTLVEQNPDSVDAPDLLRKADEFLDYWESHKPTLEMLLSHTYTIEMERNAAVLKVHMEQNDYLMTTTDLASLKENCKMLREAVTPYPHTVF